MKLLENIIIIAFIIADSLWGMSPNRQQKEIVEAVMQNNTKKIRSLIEQNPNLLNIKSGHKNGEYLIHLAPTKETVQILLELGADINALDMYRRTVLQRKIEWDFEKSMDFTKFLLDNGADITIITTAGETPIISVLTFAISKAFRKAQKRDSFHLNFREISKNLEYAFTEVLTLLVHNKRFNLEALNNAMKKYSNIMQQDSSALDMLMTPLNFWRAFFLYAIFIPMNQPLMIKTYSTFKNDLWFHKLETYDAFKVVIDCLSIQTISKSLAENFLRIDQNNPPNHFINKNLESIQNAYTFAKKHELKQLGAYILNYVKAVAGFSGTFKETHIMLGGPEKKITSFTRTDNGPQDKYRINEQSVEKYKSNKPYDLMDLDS